MKKWILGLLVLALCVGPASASSFGLFLSSYAPSGTDSGEGYGIDLEFGSQVEFEFRFALYGDLYTDADPLVYRIEAVPIDFGVNYNFAGGEKVTPYVGGGVTYIVMDFDGDTSRTTGQPRGASIKPEIGGYGQVGLDFRINDNWKASAELLYRYTQAEIQSDDIGLPRDQRLDMSGPALNIGLAIQW
jgi:opacity protein-like surface antigen